METSETHTLSSCARFCVAMAAAYVYLMCACIYTYLYITYIGVLVGYLWYSAQVRAQGSGALHEPGTGRRTTK